MAIVKKGFSIVHLNTRSLLKHLDEVRSQFDSFDFICLTETWLSCRANDHILHFPGYFIIRQDRIAIPPAKRPKKGGGILIYAKTEYEVYIQVLEGYSKCTVCSEELWIKINRPGHKRVIIGLVYRPPNGNIDTFIMGFSNTLTEILGIGNVNSLECYILGDFNIDYLQEGTRGKQNLRNIEHKFNIRQIITSPTRQTINSKSLIDLLFTTTPADLITASGIRKNVLISDHLPVYVIKKKKREKHPNTHIYIRKTALYQAEYFKNLLLDDEGWQAFWYETLNPNELWDITVEIITRCLNVLCPLKRITVRKNQPNWFDGELKTVFCRKAACYKKACVSGSQQDWDDYKELKRRARRLLISKKRGYITRQLNENRTAQKKFWKEIQNNLSFGKCKKENREITVYCPKNI